jgi:hypothetical protein
LDTGLLDPYSPLPSADGKRVFFVRRRRALQLMHSFGGWRSGQAFLVDRLALLRQLEALQDSAEVVREQRRRQRLSETLEETRRHRAAARVTLPVERESGPRTMVDLPQGMHLQPGRLSVEFGLPEELLAKLFELAERCQILLLVPAGATRRIREPFVQRRSPPEPGHSSQPVQILVWPIRPLKRFRWPPAPARGGST